MAVKIDSRCLHGIPQFSQRWATAQIDPSAASFRRKVARAHDSAPFSSRISDKEIWLALAVLDQLGFLGGTRGHAELLDMLDEAQVSTSSGEILGQKNLTRFIARYRRAQNQFSAE